MTKVYILLAQDYEDSTVVSVFAKRAPADAIVKAVAAWEAEKPKKPTPVQFDPIDPTNTGTPEQQATYAAAVAEWAGSHPLPRWSGFNIYLEEHEVIK